MKITHHQLKTAEYFSYDLEASFVHFPFLATWCVKYDV